MRCYSRHAHYAARPRLCTLLRHHTLPGSPRPSSAPASTRRCACNTARRKTRRCGCRSRSGCASSRSSASLTSSTGQHTVSASSAVGTRSSASLTPSKGHWPGSSSATGRARAVASTGTPLHSHACGPARRATTAREPLCLQSSGHNVLQSVGRAQLHARGRHGRTP